MLSPNTNHRSPSCPPVHTSGEGEHIQQCFRESPYLPLRGIRCTVNGSTACLEGSLPSFYLKQLAQEIVKQHECVEQVNNWIIVSADA